MCTYKKSKSSCRSHKRKPICQNSRSSSACSRRSEHLHCPKIRSHTRSPCQEPDPCSNYISEPSPTSSISSCHNQCRKPSHKSNCRQHHTRKPLTCKKPSCQKVNECRRSHVPKFFCKKAPPCRTAPVYIKSFPESNKIRNCTPKSSFECLFKKGNRNCAKPKSSCVSLLSFKSTSSESGICDQFVGTPETCIRIRRSIRRPPSTCSRRTCLENPNCRDSSCRKKCSSTHRKSSCHRKTPRPISSCVRDKPTCSGRRHSSICSRKSLCSCLSKKGFKNRNFYSRLKDVDHRELDCAPCSRRPSGCKRFFCSRARSPQEPHEKKASCCTCKSGLSCQSKKSKIRQEHCQEPCSKKPSCCSHKSARNPNLCADPDCDETENRTPSCCRKLNKHKRFTCPIFKNPDVEPNNCLCPEIRPQETSFCDCKSASSCGLKKCCKRPKFPFRKNRENHNSCIDKKPCSRKPSCCSRKSSCTSKNSKKRLVYSNLQEPSCTRKEKCGGEPWYFIRKRDSRKARQCKQLPCGTSGCCQTVPLCPTICPNPRDLQNQEFCNPQVYNTSPVRRPSCRAKPCGPQPTCPRLPHNIPPPAYARQPFCATQSCFNKPSFNPRPNFFPCSRLL